MKQEADVCQRLKEVGMTDEMISEYQRCVDAGNRPGQERLLCRLRRMQYDKLERERQKLACLDYITAKVEKTQTFFAHQ